VHDQFVAHFDVIEDDQGSDERRTFNETSEWIELWSCSPVNSGDGAVIYPAQISGCSEEI
jgi:hypothetical protein